MKVGSIAPDFTLPNSEGKNITLSSLRGRPVVLAFYPADNTAVCTKQLCDYRDAWANFSSASATILAISTDSVESHRKFKEEQGFPFELLSDESKTVGKLYGAAMPILNIMKRAVFVIDKKGIVRHKYIELTPLTRRKSGELISVLESLEKE